MQLFLSTEKTRWGTLLCFRKLDRKISHVSRFSVDIFLSHSTEKNLVEQFGVSENFGYRKKFLQMWDHDFLSQIFCLTGPKNFAREPFCVPENSWYRKNFMDKRRWGITFFRRKFLCLTVPKNFVGGPLYSRNVLVSNFFWILGVSRFCRFFLSHTAEKSRRGALLCFTKWYPKIFWKRAGGGSITFFCQKFLV